MRTTFFAPVVAFVVAFVVAMALAGGAAGARAADTTSGTGASPQSPPEQTMTVRGNFDVKTIPQAPDSAAAGPFTRLVLDKRYHGELDATGQGQMLAFQSHQEGSAGYVAMERVTGTLAGRTGSFVLQHIGTMKQGAVVTLAVTVVPDSGTGDLTGLAGDLSIIFEGSQHVYEFHYTLPGD